MLLKKCSKLKLGSILGLGGIYKYYKTRPSASQYPGDRTRCRRVQEKNSQIGTEIFDD